MRLIVNERSLACISVVQVPAVSMKTFCKTLHYCSRGTQWHGWVLDSTVRCAHLQGRQQLYSCVAVRPWERWEGQFEHLRRQLP